MPHFVSLLDFGINLDRVISWAKNGDGTLRLWFSKDHLMDVGPPYDASVLAAIRAASPNLLEPEPEPWKPEDGV